jgi:hypothetical protein
MKDQNGKQLHRNVRQNEHGYWGVNVWASDGGSQCRKYYTKRSEARNGDISHDASHGAIFVAGDGDFSGRYLP